MTKTTIAWTEYSWNPVRGCSWASPGCDHCYAKAWAERFQKCLGNPFEAGFDLRLAPHKLIEPLQATKPRLIFVNSMSDLFHHRVPTDYIADILRVMEATPWHTYQVLTKRHDRMEGLLVGELAWGASLPNVWWGVTAEDRKHGFPRIDALRRVPVQHRFLSVEPLIEDLGQVNLTFIDWVIVGGESGPSARPMAPDWVRSLKDQCIGSSIPFFYKQLGGCTPDKEAPILDGKTWRQMPVNMNPASFQPSSLKARNLLIDEFRTKYGFQGGEPLLLDPMIWPKPKMAGVR